MAEGLLDTGRLGETRAADAGRNSKALHGCLTARKTLVVSPNNDAPRDVDLLDPHASARRQITKPTPFRLNDPSRVAARYGQLIAKFTAIRIIAVTIVGWCQLRFVSSYWTKHLPQKPDNERGWPRCSVPESRDAKLTRAGVEALWQAFFMAAPERRREFEPSSNRRKRRAAPWPGATT